MSGYHANSKQLKVSDEQFVKAWRANDGEITAVADACGMRVRGVLSRRRSVEGRLGISLSAQKDAVETVIRRHKARINLTIKDAVLPIAGDVHRMPGPKTVIQQAYINIVKELKPKFVILVGDVFDGARISRHPRIGFLEDRPTVRDELKAVGEWLEELEKAAPGATLIWCLGNHDARYESYLASVAPEMEGVKGMHLKDHFPKWLPCWAVHINEGTPSHTVIKHRWHNGIHAAYNNTLKSGVSFVTGHLHKLDAKKWTDFRGNRYGVDCGFMADLDDGQFVHYTEDNPKDWTSGFPIITYKDGRLMRPEFVQKWDEHHVEFRGQVRPV
jgi:hypothetical protein